MNGKDDEGMFCIKCGTQIAEGASFCHKCGTEVFNKASVQQSKNILSDTNEPESIDTAEAIQEVSKSPKDSFLSMNDGKDFKQFVDNHVRATTGFQSAEDLIMNSKPWNFAWICFGIFTLLGIIFGEKSVEGMFTGILIIGGFCGYIAMYIVGAYICKRYRRKFCGKFEQEINTDDFLLFMNGHLGIVSSDFHKCGYLNQRGGILTYIDKAVSKASNEVTLCCEFGPKKKHLATIWIRSDLNDPESGRMFYGVGAERNGFMIDGRESGFRGHACLIKTAPIMQAVIEYYLQHSNKINRNEEKCS